MTDTGQVPGEGLPESAGMVEQPGVAAPGAYTYLSETAAEDDELLLPGAQGAWGNEVPPPAPEPVVQVVHEPVAQEHVIHEPGPHEMSGRDSGSIDLGAVRHPVATPVPQPPVARRPLHMGPPTPDASASPVRSLADRGPADAPVPPGAVRHSGPPTTGPEYLDVPPPGVTPWGTPVPAEATPAPAVPVEDAAGETVVPQEEQVSLAVADAPQQAEVLRQAQDAEALHQAQDAAYAQAQEAAAAQVTEAQLRVPETAEVLSGAPDQAAEAVAVPPVAEAVEVPVPPVGEAVEAPSGMTVVEVPPGVEAPQDPERVGAATDAQVPAPVPPEAVPAEPAAPAAVPTPDATPFPPAAQGPEQMQAQVPIEAQEVPRAPEEAEVPQEPEAAAQPVDADVAPPADAAVAQADAVASSPDAVVPSTVAAGADQDTAAPDQPATTGAADEADGQAVAVAPDQPAPDEEAVAVAPDQPAPDEEAVAVAPDHPALDEEAGTAAPDQIATDVSAEEQAGRARQSGQAAEAAEAAEEPALAQDPQQQMDAPVGQEPQTAEDPAAEAQPAEGALPPQPEPAAEEAPTPEPLQSLAAVQGPQAAESVTPDAEAPDQAAQVAEATTQPETAESPAIEAETETEAEAETADVNVNVAEQPDEAPAPEPLPAEQPTDEAPAEPAEPSVAAQPEVAEPVAADVEPVAAGLADAEQTVAEPSAAEAPAPVTPQEPHAEQPMGEFVTVEGSVPTTPHLAPTPPQGMVAPPLPADDQPTPPTAEAPTETAEEAPAPEPTAEPVAMVPAPRDSEAETIVVPKPLAAAVAEPDVVQNVEDLDTRAADQEDSETAAEAVAAAEESTAPVEEAPEDVREADVREEVRQPTGPAAPAYDEAEREAVLKVMRERRDIRNGFRSDPIPHEVLLRVLEAAHTAPSVGHSQPWDFVVIRSAETRRTMHELAQRQREAYANSLPKGRAKQFKELKIEAILETPVNIVVTADPTRGGRHTLGRHTQPQMAPYSSALAVENLWLAARAEGLGVGWVSFFDEREMVRALGLPEHLEVVAYLCVGYVDEFPEEPELMQAGWAKRRPLSWVVHEETYGRRVLPGAEPHDLLAETVAGIRPLDAKALGEAWERQKRMTKPAGALGMLEIISAQLSGLSRQCPPPIPEPAAVAIFAGDHGVHAQGVTPWPQEVTAQMVANFLGGGAVCNAFATQVGAEVCVIDVGVASDLPATPGLLPRKVRAGTSDMTTGPAMTREEAQKAIEVGIETARDLVAAGNKALLTGEMGIANTTVSAALIAVFTGADPSEVTGRGTGINDETLARKTEIVRRAIELHQPDPADPIGVLAAIGGFEHAAIVGLLLGGASLRTPVILDGVSAGAAALVARAIAPEVLAACIAGHRSAEPGHVAALKKLGLRPLVDLDLRLGEGTGALLALPVVQSAARAMHEVATFDSAGVTEK